LEKYRRFGQATDGNTVCNTARAHYMLDKKAANTYPEYEVFIDFRGQ